MSTDLVQEVAEARALPRPALARAIRREAGVSQTRMASELCVHRVTFARWESGASEPRAAHRLAWARLLARLQEVT
jgi:DNA-binding transcriptional regulator YiaG